jgi:hypothetical protein
MGVFLSTHLHPALGLNKVPSGMFCKCGRLTACTLSEGISWDVWQSNLATPINLCRFTGGVELRLLGPIHHIALGELMKK